MKYKVCVATGKTTGRVITTLLHVVETNEKVENYSLENERFYFDYYFFDTEEKARQFIQDQRK